MTAAIKGYKLLQSLPYSQFYTGSVVCEIRLMRAGALLFRPGNGEYYFQGIPNLRTDKMIGGYILTDTPKIHWTEVESHPELFESFEL